MQLQKILLIFLLKNVGHHYYHNNNQIYHKVATESSQSYKKDLKNEEIRD